MTGPRTYSGWKAGLLVVLGVVVLIVGLNVLAQARRDDPPSRDPGPVVTTVTPSS